MIGAEEVRLRRSDERGRWTEPRTEPLNRLAQGLGPLQIRQGKAAALAFRTCLGYVGAGAPTRRVRSGADFRGILPSPAHTTPDRRRRGVHRRAFRASWVHSGRRHLPCLGECRARDHLGSCAVFRDPRVPRLRLLPEARGPIGTIPPIRLSSAVRNPPRRPPF